MILCDAPAAAIVFYDWSKIGITEKEALSVPNEGGVSCRYAVPGRIEAVGQFVLSKHLYQLIGYQTKSGNVGWLVVQEIVPDADKTNRVRAI